jgi:tRNA nucleotidyltransferase (CCA-adding enzyme)
MKIPLIVKKTVQQLQAQSYEAYLVGGCVRDLLLGKEPHDWDIATNAQPKEIMAVFPKKAFLDNQFGTVTVRTSSSKPSLKEIEITPYRLEGPYKDQRHPDSVNFETDLKGDLSRRDFTINALALDIQKRKPLLIDLFEGEKDLERGIIRAVGDPAKRLAEDGLRLMRAVRLATTLNFKLEEKTQKALQEKAPLLANISPERIRDEFMKIINSSRASQGIEMLRQFSLLHYIIPELEEGYQVSQNKHHIYDVYEHLLRSLDYAVQKNFSPAVRLAALFHDVGKPRTKEGEGPDSTFYNHEVVGAKMTRKIMTRLKFPRREVEKVVLLVRYHLFYYNVGEVGESSVRRLVRKVGLENMKELLELRMADRIGSGVPKAKPYKLRHLAYMVDKVSKDPISVEKLKISGYDVMKILQIKPGPKVGQILNILLDQVLDDPKKNKPEILKKMAEELETLSSTELEKKSQQAKEKINQIQESENILMKEKHWVK